MNKPSVKKKILDTAFKKGNEPWNKDLKGIHLSPASEFKKRQHVGKEHASWKGGVQRNEKDCTYLWAGCNKRKRRPRLVYEKHYGKLSKGLIIYHKDGDKDNDSIRNLVAITRAEILKLNQEHWRKRK